MTDPAHMLAYAALLCWLMIIGAAMLRTNGNLFLMVGNRDDLPAPSALAERADRAAKNMIENLVLFTAAYIAAAAAGAHGWQMERGPQIFVIARVAYWGLYLGGVKWVRTTAWLVGVIGIGLLLWGALAA